MVDEMPTLPGLSDPLEDGEPIFPLRARDPLAPHMAALWAALRKGDTASALSIFSDMVSDPGHKYRTDLETALNPETADKVKRASAKAQEMNTWRKDRGLSWYGLHTV